MSDHADIVAEATAQDGTPFRVVLEYDYDAESPRGFDGRIGVIHVADQPRTIVPREADVYGLDSAIDDHDFRVVARWLRIFHGATVVLPVHGREDWSGFAPSAGSSDDAPQTGDYAGVTFDTPTTRRESGFPDGATDGIGAAMAAELDEYAAWASGETYGYVVQRANPDEDDEPSDWAYVDDCWGHIGRDWAEQAARDALADAVAEHDRQVADAVAEHDRQVAEGIAEDTAAMLAELGGAPV